MGNTSITTRATPEAVNEIKQLHQETIEAIENAVARAIRIGELLTTIRADFPARATKGEGFAEWVQNELPFSARTAWQYMRTYEHRDTLQINPEMTFRKAIAQTTTPKQTTGEYGVLQESQAIYTSYETDTHTTEVLETRDEKQAQRLTNFFNVPIEQARSYVLSRKKPKGSTKKKDRHHLTPRTIRLPIETDDMIEAVARKEKRSFADVANEMLESGRKKFAKVHGFTL